MKVRVLLSAAVCCALLSGCVHHHGHGSHRAKVITPAKVVVPVPVVVETGNGGKKHCPPGQAKKGNC